ncbi:NAD(P)/FAD-dependent oxidoreductase [Actinocorallia longicatena]|uniref:FAD-dependent oxidoreductase n=1 Tax=Actinocorallia longicatena TaxID=111803 RepID=A0ABP6PVW0_9ACTN
MPDPSRPSRIVIVGTGIAGTTAALTLRDEGFTGSIVLVGAEPAEPYRRPPLSKDLLAGRVPAERLRIKAPEYWETRGIGLRTGTEAVAAGEGRVLLADGASLPYDRLLLATGGRPRTLPGASTLRTLGDALALRAALDDGRPLAVVGGGLVGLEVAATARGLGADVTVVEAAPRVLGRILPGPLAEPIERLHREHGVELHTGRAFTGAAPGTHVLAAIGTEPETGLAERAGLAVADGIVVDARLATSDPAVYAAGDAARTPSGRREHWSDAQAQGVTAARNMLGAALPHTAAPWCWSDQYGLTLQICGALEGEQKIDGDPSELDASVSFISDGVLTGAVCFNRPKDFRTLRANLGT